MFNKAYNIANKFTFPLVVALHYFDNTIEGGLGSFIVLNNEGWCLTAAHNFGAFFAFDQHTKEIKEYKEKVDKINNSSQLKDEKKRAHIKDLKPNQKWVTDYSIMLSGQPINIEQLHIYGENDIAIFKIDPQVIKGQTVFPKIKASNSISPGTSLCKFGYPFIEVRPNFDNGTKQFTLPPGLMPFPLFPIEGIYTRNINSGKTKDGTLDILFLETSSPGLKGQSGGPIVDTDGNIYAIQSRNFTLPLGFKGLADVKGKKIEENQFLNIGVGVHPAIIEQLLKKHNIKYDIEP